MTDTLIERLRLVRRNGLLTKDRPRKDSQLHSVCQEAADRLEAMQEALEWYANQMCEGWCDKDPKACEAIGPENCAGCPARVALGSKP